MSAPALTEPRTGRLLSLLVALLLAALILTASGCSSESASEPISESTTLPISEPATIPFPSQTSTPTPADEHASRVFEEGLEGAFGSTQDVESSASIMDGNTFVGQAWLPDNMSAPMSQDLYVLLDAILGQVDPCTEIQLSFAHPQDDGTVLLTVFRWSEQDARMAVVDLEQDSPGSYDIRPIEGTEYGASGVTVPAIEAIAEGVAPVPEWVKAPPP